MIKSIKRLFSIVLIATLFIVTMLPNISFASDSEHDCNYDCLSTYISNSDEKKNWNWEKEVFIEVANEEEALSYPRNPNYKYNFIYTSPLLTRAICHMCGGYGMGLVTRRSEYGNTPKDCPLFGAGLDTDFFYTWYHYSRERCTSCGYSSEEWLASITYSASCNNGDNPGNGLDWEVREEYTAAKGYDPHQSLHWWLYKEIVYLPQEDIKQKMFIA